MGKLSGLLAGIGKARGAIAGAAAVGYSDESEGSFIGKAAKTFNWAAHKLAKDMEGAGATRDQIWKATGEQFGTPLYRGPDGLWRQEISDRFDIDDELLEVGARWDRDNIDALLNGKVKGITQPMAMKHEELYAAYPDMETTSLETSAGFHGERGSYSPDRDVVSINPERLSRAVYPETTKDLTDPLSTNLHELQHAIQYKEGYAKGGNPSTVQHDYYDDLRTRYSQSGGYQLTVRSEELWHDYGNWARIDHIQSMQNIKQPRQLFNSSYYYEYSDELRKHLGAPPKRGKERLEWAQDAGRWIAEQIKSSLDWRQLDLAETVGNDRDLVKKNLRSLQGKINRLPKDQLQEARNLRNEMEKYDPYEKGHLSMDDSFQMYKRLTGEAEARNVQTRLPMSMQERIAKPPWQTLDVPENELINKFRMGLPLTAGAGLSTAALISPEQAEAAGLPPASTGTMEAQPVPAFGQAANYLDSVELPAIGRPFEGVAEWARGVGYQDSYWNRLKRAAKGALDLM